MTKKQSEDAIEMFVGGLVLDPNTQAPVIVLKDEDGQYVLPIWIGVAEATSIASVLKQLTLPRPLTHDLVTTFFGELGVKVERIVITALKEATYFAEIILSQGDRAIILDCRPSDAIAIALRASSPIYVVRSVLDQAKVTFVDSKAGGAGRSEEMEAGEGEEADEANSLKDLEGSFTNIDRDKWEEILKDLDPEDFKYKM